MDTLRLRFSVVGIVLAALALLLLLLMKSGGSDPSSPGGDMPMEELAIGINGTLKSAPVVVALERGFFEENDIQAQVTLYPSGVAAISALFDGELDVTAVPEHVAAFTSLERGDFRVLAVVNRNTSAEVVGRRDRGIESVADLEGKRIGLKKKSSSPYWLNRLLIYNNLSIEDVELVDATPADLPMMIAEGAVDAVITWHPYAYDCRKALRDNAYYADAQLGQDMYWLVVGMTGWLDEHPEIVLRYLLALQEAVDYINAHPDEAKEIVTQYLGLEREQVDFEWPLYTFRLELPQSLLLALEQECRWKIEQMEGEAEMPNYLTFIHFDGLSTLAPEAVTIIHEQKEE